MLTGRSTDRGAYLVVLAVDVGHHHDDGEAHEGDQGELPREAEHEDHHARDLDRVPQEDVDILGDQVADHGGVRGGKPTLARPGPRSPEALGGPTCAILIKEACLLRHQRAEETVSKANVQSGKYEGKNASSDTCGKRANCR